MTTPANEAPASFIKPAKEIWRWYAWTRMKISEEKRWIPTCWKFDSKQEALENSSRPLMEDDTLILVREATTHTADDMLTAQNERTNPQAMTPAQLDHLRKIDAHLERLLELAAKRTPGEWNTESDWPRVMCGAKQIVQVPQKLTMRNKEPTTPDARFIASCAGNAEAGWKATRAAIAECLEMQEAVEIWKDKNVTGWLHMLRFACDAVAKPILAAFPLEVLEA